MEKKRLLSLVVIVAALAAMLIAPMAGAAAPNGAPMIGTVVGAPLGLRFRAGPQLDEPVMLVLYNGEQVTMLGEKVWNQGIRWSKVEVTRWGKTSVGWVASAYLDVYPGYDEPVGNFPGDEGCKVTSAIGLRLRAEPNLGGAIKRIVPYGTVLVPTGEDNVSADGHNWVNLFIDGYSLWGSEKFLDCFENVIVVEK